MPTAIIAAGFLGGAALSLLMSWVLVSRIERIGERLGVTEAFLGLVAALAADSPEVTSAVTALAGRQNAIGVGVVIGSNVFNLAALLGLAAVVAGLVQMHRKVILMNGVVAMWAAGMGLLAVSRAVSPPLALAGLAVIFFPYVALLAYGRNALPEFALPARWARWFRQALSLEKMELTGPTRPRPGRGIDVLVGIGALILVVGASIVMERSAAVLGSRYAVPSIVIGGLVLAAATSVPNAVSAIYLAQRGRGAAVLSIALNSNTLNLVAGLLIPGVIVGLGAPTFQATSIAVWNAGLTLFALLVAYRYAGVRRPIGYLIVSGYVAFVVFLLLTA